IVATVQYIIERYQFPEKEEDFIKSCIGGGARNVLLKSLGSENEALIDQEILDVFKSYYLEHCDQFTYLYPGVKETLEHYFGHKKLAIATYKIKTATEKILKTLGIDHYFDYIVTADDVENPKPHPECIYKILKYYPVKAEKTVLIGDTKTDFMTGHNAEIDVCAVTYGYGSEENLKTLNPTYLVDQMSKIKEFIL
ncbi:MAG: HAD family hydrolase, partial [Eubacterium sp.]